jgi:hypothetical protein
MNNNIKNGLLVLLAFPHSGSSNAKGRSLIIDGGAGGKLGGVSKIIARNKGGHENSFV